MQEWLTELDGFYIPDLSPTTDGSCAGDPAAAAQAALNGWWTCGGYTRPTGESLYIFSLRKCMTLFCQILRLALTR